MVDKRIVDWIKSEEASGYTEEQLRESLLESGYKFPDIDEAIRLSRETAPKAEKEASSFFQYIAKKGILFSILFYFFTGIFVLQVLLGIAASIITFNIFGLIPSAIFVILSVYYVMKRKLYSLLMMVFFFFPGMFLSFMLYPLAQTFVGISNTALYMMMSIQALVLGFIFAFMFGRVVDNFQEYLKSAITFSCMLSVIFAFNNLIYVVYAGLMEQLSAIGSGTFISSFGYGMVNPYTSFALTFIFLNIPYVIYYFKIQHKNKSRFLLYLIPIALFIILSLAFGYVAGILVDVFFSPDGLLSFLGAGLSSLFSSGGIF